MIRNMLRSEINKALKKLGIDQVEIDLDRTTDKKFGDFTTNAALRFSRDVKQSPLDFAKKISDSLKDLPWIEKLEVKEPGFVNLYIKDSIWQNEVKEVLEKGNSYGNLDLNKGKKARVEFVSANPTGPLHFGNARGGPIGDTLASVLEASGYGILREYYQNDVGVQVHKLGESIMNVNSGKSLEEQEYKGEYIRELAGKIKAADPIEAGKQAVKMLLDEAIGDCKSLGIEFDKVYSESEFIDSGKTQKAIEDLDKKGFIRQQDGAKWFAPNDEFLKDRETVVVKSDGTYTYFANDIAYHKEKFDDGYDLVIDVFGANHHGHVPRLQAAISAVGGDVRQFHVLLYQWVRFMAQGRLANMSKRAGTIMTAKEVLDAVGRDAVRFFILERDINSYIDFDLNLAREKSTKNPVYYVQYAHARICSILSKLEEKNKNDADYSLLTTEYELDLIKQITRLPELVEDISKSFAVHYLTTYARDLADSFHSFYENCRVVGEEDSLLEARVGLLLATQLALQNTLKLIGVSAPEKM